MSICGPRNLKVIHVAAMPITKATAPKGKTQRCQDFSAPPVAKASLLRVAVESVAASPVGGGGGPGLAVCRHDKEFDLQTVIVFCVVKKKVPSPPESLSKGSRVLGSSSMEFGRSRFPSIVKEMSLMPDHNRTASRHLLLITSIDLAVSCSTRLPGSSSPLCSCSGLQLLSEAPYSSPRSSLLFSFLC
ncbi:hypothetical protein GDO81_016707 [Engystomops pustulosus]|uniref:Uncharacterized protein n=1 Tax=Engystomops pustulosus TaxID=76066 RepID=A0AAV7A877_ENGPU|nr:hypothetical protein GDO81_016707 [Engystomops pustulosus]